MPDFRALRAQLGLTQAEAAAKFGVTRQTWQNWEKGRKPSGAAAIMADNMLTMQIMHVHVAGDLYRAPDGAFYLYGQDGSRREVPTAEAQRLAPGMIP